MAAAFDEATEALSETFRSMFLSSCDPSSVSLFSSVMEDSGSSLLSDLAEFDSLLLLSGGNTTGDDMVEYVSVEEVDCVLCVCWEGVCFRVLLLSAKRLEPRDGYTMAKPGVE